jgi:hypothetical protein
MSFLDTLFSDLREKRLWPVAVVLLVAIVAIPVLLPKKTKAPPAAQVTPLAVPVTQLSAVPAVSVQSTPTVSNLKGPARDPFTQPTLPSSTTTSSTTSTTAASTSSSGATSTTPTTSTTSTTPTATTTTPSSGVTYLIFSVDLVLSKNGGHPSTLRDITRLTPLPSSSSPFLVYLGVKTDHNTATFLVSSQAKPAGQGKCIPSARQCQFLDLKLGQQEAFLVVASSGHVDQYVVKLTAIRLKTTTASGATTLLHSGESSVAGLFDLPSATKSSWFGQPASGAQHLTARPGH